MSVAKNGLSCHTREDSAHKNVHVNVKQSFRDYPKMGDARKYNVVLFAITGLTVIVFSVMFFLAMVQYRSEMAALQESIYSLRSDILVQMARDKRNHYDSKRHKVHKREAGEELDLVAEQLLGLLDTNFTRLDDVANTPLKALQNVTSEIADIKDALKTMKHEFSEDRGRLKSLAGKIQNCGKSESATIFGQEILKIVMTLADNIASLKRVIIYSALKSTSVRNNVALMRRFECTLRESLSKVESRIETLEGMSQNLTDHSMDLGYSLDDIRMDIGRITSEINLSNEGVLTSIASQLDVVEDTCSDTQFLQTVFEHLKTGVSAITNSTGVIDDKLRDISEKAETLKTDLEGANTKLTSLEQSQNNIGETCTENGHQAAAILVKLDLFNETEPELNYTITEYCALKHGCVKVKEFKKHCYKVFDTISRSWFDASEMCSQEGSYLAEINSDVEYQKLTTFIPRTKYYWIGGTDQNSEGSWYWGNSKTRVWLNAWRGRNPSNDGGVEHCMHLYANRISWNDGNCLARHSFICERDYNCEGWD